jgi:hypothetical protein
MLLFNLMGIVLTLITLAFLALAGYLSALRLLGAEAERDALALAIAALLAATAEALGIALLLGALGVLRLDLGLALLVLLVLVLLRAGGGPAGVAPPARRLAARAWARLAEHPALALLAAHAVGSEALRGLLRPPLSWDSLMYHLMLAADWLQEGNLRPVFGSYPVNDYGFVPANGSLWLWWWMAPSHSELYVNLSALAHWALLALATGGIARALGARRHWPLATFAVAVVPTVARFAATQYVDIFLAAALLAAAFFGLRWLAPPREPGEPRWADAALAGAGLGIVCGAKLFGVPYAMVLAAGVVLAARGGWRRRLPQLALALLLCAALGSFFYLRNIAYGAGPLAIVCEGRSGPPPAHALPALPRPGSVVDVWERVGHDQVLDAFLGITRPQSIELGAGPAAFLLLAALVAFPFGVAPARRRTGWVVAGQAAFELLFWLTVPFADNLNIFANVRYLIPAIGIALAGGVAAAEERGVSDGWLAALALIVAIQSLLQLHAEMPHEVRVILGVIDVGLAALAVSPALRGFARRHARGLALAALAGAVLGAPYLARFRVADRDRALRYEWTTHSTSAKLFAPGWEWLDRHGGDGAVDVVSAPGTYFVYPAMGPYLERRARYVNVNRENFANAARYPRCDPRVDPSPDAWIANLAASRTRWVLLARYPQFDFPMERGWAEARPDLFALRHADPTNLVYEFLPAARAGA